jgi:hypothetical protein
MGMSLRAKLTLPFSFPSLVWKSLIKEELGMTDLRNIDPDIARHIEHLDAFLDPSKDSNSLRDSFNVMYGEGSELYCTFVDDNGVEEEVLTNGRYQKVTLENLPIYLEALRAKKLHQYDMGIQAIAKGFNEVVPLRAVCLFSWHDLEVLVSGHAVFNIPLWKANTESLSTLSPHVIDLFWKVIENLSSKEQEGFVRFAWGRSRLPNTPEEFVVKMKLGPAGMIDAKLPIAHVR